MRTARPPTPTRGHAPTPTRPRRTIIARNAPPATVTLTFTTPDGRSASVAATPGQPLLDAANAAAAAAGDPDCIVVGCCSGSCGVCEVELVRRGAVDGGPDGATTVVRSCITAVPAGYAQVDVSMLPDDAQWSVDAWDT